MGYLTDCVSSSQGELRSPAAYLPVFRCGVQAGFPSPAIEGLFDRHWLLLRHLDAACLVRVVGEHTSEAAIHPGDLLAVNKHLEANRFFYV